MCATVTSANVNIHPSDQTIDSLRVTEKRKSAVVNRFPASNFIHDAQEITTTHCGGRLFEKKMGICQSQCLVTKRILIAGNNN